VGQANTAPRMLLFANHLEPLPVRGADICQSVTLLMPLSNSNIWFTTLDAPDTFAD